jgi:hypothetical protein
MKIVKPTKRFRNKLRAKLLTQFANNPMRTFYFTLIVGIAAGAAAVNFFNHC